MPTSSTSMPTLSTLDRIINDLVVTQTATPRHMSRLLRLLPSGPGRVHRVSLRGDRKGHHRGFKLLSL